MGVLKWLFGAGVPRSVVYPGPEAATPRAAIELALRRVEELGDGWITVRVPGVERDDEAATLQISGRDVNMLLWELPEELVSALSLTRKKRGWYTASSDDPAHLSAVAETIVMGFFGADPIRALEIEIERG